MTGTSMEPPAAEPEAAEVLPAPAQEGGDAFRLGGELPRVMRLSRKALAIAGGAAGIAIGGALLWALRPTELRAPTELYQVADANRPENVTSAPADYRAVPKLGPPLPGDLGRPIVAAQKGEGMPPPAMAVPGAQDPRAAEAEQRRQRSAQEREAAPSSRLFLASGGSADRVSEAGGKASEVAGAEGAPSVTNTAAASRRRFLAGGSKLGFESDERPAAPSSPYILQAGAVIPAALITGIRSDLPGQISAQVTQNIYDSPTGRLLLIPQGARLVGEYDSEIAAGQTRILLAWDRLILPGGTSIRLDRQPAGDASGMAGVQDRVDNHWGRMLRAALLSSLLGFGSEIASDDDHRIVRAVRTGFGESVNETGRRLVERETAVPPTLTIRPGYAFRVIVTRDVILDDGGAGRDR